MTEGVSTLGELRGSADLLRNLTLREIRGKYKRTALGQATSPQEWNTFLLASPESMQG